MNVSYYSISKVMESQVAFEQASILKPKISPAEKATGVQPVSELLRITLPDDKAGFFPMIVFATVGSEVAYVECQISIVHVGEEPMATMDQPVIVPEKGILLYRVFPVPINPPLPSQNKLIGDSLSSTILR